MSRPPLAQDAAMSELLRGAAIFVLGMGAAVCLGFALDMTRQPLKYEKHREKTKEQQRIFQQIHYWATGQWKP